jgi:hypothetical protein
MLRHTALFLWRDTTRDEQKLAALKGLAYLRYGCPSVREVDFGADLLGGSAPMLETKPWERTPLWNARAEGPPSTFDMALHLDFDDQAGLDAYNTDHAHHEVALYNTSVCRPERTARVDWWYEGPPRGERGGVRHTSLFLWADEVSDAQKTEVRDAFSALSQASAGLRSVLVADNVGMLRTDYDVIVDAELDDLKSAEALLTSEPFSEALSLAAAVTKYEWTARITHPIRAG